MFDSRKEKLRKFQDFIGYRFQNEGLLAQSLTTPRMGNLLGTKDYEFLETLGDAVIKIIFILKLYNLGIQEPGNITLIKASLENDKVLRTVADRMDLQSFIFKADKQKIKGTRILADVFEAICGAIFFDSNYNIRVVEEKMIDPFYKDFDSIIKSSMLDKKNDLLEFLQDKFKTSIKIKLKYEKKGYEHDPNWIAKNPEIIERSTNKILIKLPKNIISEVFGNKKDAERDIYLKILNYLEKKT